jgi:hypothetical protein
MTPREGLPIRPPKLPTVHDRHAAAHQGDFTQGPVVRQTDHRRPPRQGPIGIPTGWPPRKWLVR